MKELQPTSSRATFMQGTVTRSQYQQARSFCGAYASSSFEPSPPLCTRAFARLVLLMLFAKQHVARANKGSDAGYPSLHIPSSSVAVVCPKTRSRLCTWRSALLVMVSALISLVLLGTRLFGGVSAYRTPSRVTRQTADTYTNRTLFAIHTECRG